MYRYDQQELFDNALSNLDSLSLVINSDYFFESIMCIESVYNLSSFD